jgi:hypothetical protein
MDEDDWRYASRFGYLSLFYGGYLRPLPHERLQ